ncbi:hypothetical protein QCN27_15015 [Cereibacter sp. SYSU M97828]|nr:hypothetical protein [Cereibacter flavus]
MIRRLSFLAALSLTACTPAAYLPGAQVVTVGEREHTVRRSGGGYTAQMNNAVFAAEPTEGEVYVGNLRAIRDVTGCPVEVRSVVNEGGRTDARLACPPGRTPRL